MSEQTRYWGYRIDKNNIGFFQKELKQGRLRQGWGWDERQDLRRTEDFLDEGAERNRRIFRDVKRGHILLVPQLPNWNSVTIVRATEDFDQGYRFDISAEHEDYGHCFPAECVCSFQRSGKAVSGNIRTTLKNRSRFWSLDWCSEDVERLIVATKEDRLVEHSIENKLRSAVDGAVGQILPDLECKASAALHDAFEGKQWEYALQEILGVLHPSYTIETVGGPSESEHGTDLLLSIPGLENEVNYGIAIQVKDQTELTQAALDQIRKADCYWEGKRELKIIDKYVVVTKAERHAETPGDIEIPNDVRVIWKRDLEEIIRRYAIQRTSTLSKSED